MKDPVCHMDIDAAKAPKSELRGQSYYFCSQMCKEQFEKDPSSFLSKQPAGSEQGQ